MDEKGISTYYLREKCGIDSKTIRRLKANENIETKTLDKSVPYSIADWTTLQNFTREGV